MTMWISTQHTTARQAILPGRWSPTLDRQSAMLDLLQRLESWLGSHDPDLVATLRPGATEDDLDEIQKLFPVSLPTDFRSLYRWHDGQEEGGVLPALGGRVTEGALLPSSYLRQTILEFRSRRSREGLPMDWWGPGFLPFLDAGNGDFMVLDLPTGKIKEFLHDTLERPTVHTSLRSWLEKVSREHHQAGPISGQSELRLAALLGDDDSRRELGLESFAAARNWSELREWILSMRSLGSRRLFARIALETVTEEPRNEIEMRLLEALRSWLHKPGAGSRTEVADLLAKRRRTFVRADEACEGIRFAAEAAMTRDPRGAAHCALHALAAQHPELAVDREPEAATEIQAELRRVLQSRS